MGKLIHGHARRQALSPTWRVWEAMMERCYAPSNANFKNYGGRGITVCQRWHQFTNFLQDMGERPPRLQIDRMDNSLWYSKQNCRWATAKVNANNRRNSRRFQFSGKDLTVGEISELTGLKKVTLWRRLYAGWSLNDAFGLAADNFGPRIGKEQQWSP